jgi:hypothetical protein
MLMASFQKLSRVLASSPAQFVQASAWLLGPQPWMCYLSDPDQAELFITTLTVQRLWCTRHISFQLYSDRVMT